MSRKEQWLQQIFPGFHLSEECKNLCNLKTNTCPFLLFCLCKLDASHDNRNTTRIVYLGLSYSAQSEEFDLQAFLVDISVFCNTLYFLQHSLNGGFAYISLPASSINLLALTLWGHHLAIVCILTSHSALFAFILHLFWLSAVVLCLYLSAVWGEYSAGKVNDYAR